MDVKMNFYGSVGSYEDRTGNATPNKDGTPVNALLEEMATKVPDKLKKLSIAEMHKYQFSDFCDAKQLDESVVAANNYIQSTVYMNKSTYLTVASLIKPGSFDPTTFVPKVDELYSDISELAQ